MGVWGAGQGAGGSGYSGGARMPRQKAEPVTHQGPLSLGTMAQWRGPLPAPGRAEAGVGLQPRGTALPTLPLWQNNAPPPPNSFPPSFLGALVSGWGAKPLGCWKCFFLFVWQVALCSGTRPSPQGMGAEEAITAGFLKPKGLLCKGVERAGV